MALKTSGYSGSNGGGDFFKPKEHLDHVALLIEPTGHRQVTSKKFGNEDTYTDANIVLFPTKNHLLGTEEPIELGGVTIGGGVLARNMSEEVGNSCFGRLVQKPSDKGNPFQCLEAIGDPAAVEAIEKYLVKRDKAIEDAVPSYLR